MLDGGEMRLSVIGGTLSNAQEDQETLFERMAYIASVVLQHGGVCICTSRYSRKLQRSLLLNSNKSVVVQVDAPKEVCKVRDPNKYWLLNYANEDDFGIEPDLKVDSFYQSPAQAMTEIWKYLLKNGFIKAKLTEDEAAFGLGSWLYCQEHLLPHQAGWCSAPVSEKISLGASSSEEAYSKSRALGLIIKGDKLEN